MNRKYLTSEEVQQILKLYPDTKAQVIADQFGVPVRKIYATAKRYGIKKSEDFLYSDQSGRIQKGQSLSPSTCFQKGCQSATKGKRMEALIKSEEKKARWKARLWKKGNIPHNVGKNGEIRWRKSLGYYMIKIEDNHWVFYHRWLYEKNFGPIPPGFNIVFKDGNARNCELSNLDCLSNADLALKNSIHNYPDEIKTAIRLKNKISKTLKSKK